MRASISPQVGLGALPSWLTNIGSAIVKGTMVTIPGPAGPITFDLGDPQGTAKAKAAFDAAVRAAKGAQISTTVSNRPPSLLETVNQSVPGGWATLALGGLALLVAVPLLMRGRR